jgi:RND superfamily putative drug exporter
VISLVATFGLLTWFWQEGHGWEAFFGISATGATSFWLPLMVFVFLFWPLDGLRGLHSHAQARGVRPHGSTDAAVIEGLRCTGRIVTSAALIPSTLPSLAASKRSRSPSPPRCRVTSSSPPET